MKQDQNRSRNQRVDPRALIVTPATQGAVSPLIIPGGPEEVPRRGRPRPVPEPRGLKLQTARYAAPLLKILQADQAAIKKILEEFLPAAVGEARARLRLDDAAEIVMAQFENFQLGIFAESTPAVEAVVGQASDQIDELNKKNTRSQHAALAGVSPRSILAINPFFGEPWLADEAKIFSRENISLINNVRGEQIADASQLVSRMINAGERPGNIAAALDAQFDLAENNTMLIARDQTTKYHARLSRLRNLDAGLDRYRWRTAGDSRVRSEHQRLEGREFSYSDPPVTVSSGRRAGEKNNPGEDIQCRCWAEPIFDDEKKSP